MLPRANGTKEQLVPIANGIKATGTKKQMVQKEQLVPKVNGMKESGTKKKMVSK